MTPALKKIFEEQLCTLSTPQDKMAFIESVGAWLTHKHRLIQERYSVPFAEEVVDEQEVSNSRT